MVAIVVLNCEKIRKNAIKKKHFENLDIIFAGSAVGRGRLLRRLKRYGNDWVSADGSWGTFDAKYYKAEIRFGIFEKHASRVGLRVGIIDREGRFLERLTPIIKAAKETLVVTDCDLENYNDAWRLTLGTEAEQVGTVSYLFDLDLVFSADGFVETKGVLFGEGGLEPTAKDVPLPECCDEALMHGADRLTLAALLSVGG